MSNIIQKNINWLYTKLRSHTYKRHKDLWVFGEWYGSRCCDNSLALANYVAENHPEIRAVWLSKAEADLSALSPRVERLVIDTPEAAAALQQAGVAVMNQGLVDFSEQMSFDCGGAVTVNLWHGAPWKKIGTDMLLGDRLPRRIYGKYLQRLQRADMHVALSDDFANILEKNFYARRDGIILAGYPRNAAFYQADKVAASRKKVLELLRAGGTPVPEDGKIITYMPTFRDHTEAVFSFEQLAEDARLNGMLEKYDAVIVQKAHFVSCRRNGGGAGGKTSRIVAMNDIAAQELLAATDILVTDYSSCFFDFLVLDRPIVHYIYDYDYYANQDRGVYYRAEDVVCGDAPRTANDLLDALEANLAQPGKDAALREARRRKFMTYETEDSCRVIFEAIQKRQKGNAKTL